MTDFYSIINLTTIADNRGALVAIEQNKDIPFEIKRVYYIFNTKHSVARGFHAHKNLTQLAICVAGSCQILLDNGKSKKTVILDNPSKAVIIKSRVWREMYNFSKDCVLLVLADDNYDENDYIRNYEQFLALVQT